MIKSLPIFAYFLLTLNVLAEPNLHKFEGCIHLKKETFYDTSFVKIQVKENQVRLDEFDSKKNLVSVIIINLENNKVFAVSPKDKLFYEIKTDPVAQPTKEDTVVIRTENRMVLDGRSCCQMRVKSLSRNSEVTFWVIENDFAFFQSMNRILRNINSDINVFSYFPEKSGTFPMLIVERTILRKEKMKVLVTRIDETLLSENLFKIPREYQKVEP